ncbi:MAG TPA: Cys-tRNA(Pro) deacylase [Sedimenticola sp.]|nr:Cys-tRNA(Pro) deacylase [Sedimenticola sp.]
MTPAVNRVKAAQIPYRLHRYRHQKSVRGWGEEAATALGVDPARVFKTLVIELDRGGPAVAVIPVACRLSLRRCAALLGARNARMADPAVVRRATGYVLGGVSPLGQKRRLRTLVDQRAQAFEQIYVSAGRRGLELELAPDDLLGLVDGRFGSLVQEDN